MGGSNGNQWSSEYSAVSAIRFGAVKRGVCLGEYRFQRHIGLRIVARRCADAYGHGEFCASRLKGSRCDGRTDIFGARPHATLVTIAEKDKELLAAIAADRVVGTNGGNEALCNFFKNCYKVAGIRWPCSSFTCLKWSMSHNRIEVGLASRAERWSSLRTSERIEARFHSLA